MSSLRPIPLVLAGLGLALTTGCGGQPSAADPGSAPASATPVTPNPTTSPTTSPTSGPTSSGTVGVPGQVAVIRRWAARLAANDIPGAAAQFGLPTTVSNGTPLLRLTSRREVEAFNRDLPCGAVVTGTRRDGAGIVATFRLTERPGGACGPGVGSRAATRFVIRNGKIVDWRRADAPAPASATPNGTAA